ncbi:DUF1272 domain-containing protein [Exiguobacterium sp. Leaf187]|uniref:DUF1272 domain-containing protein n=1 Tax=Exiguobacterium sp. Leaf187 TaxID=1736294 RepID=UPI0009EAADC4|nr:DUF1272 domain-containing protein [Exiguobacterium sp. Leaf187]
MESTCVRCQETIETTVYQCSHACTFCEPCTKTLDHICQNCGKMLEPVTPVAT